MSDVKEVELGVHDYTEAEDWVRPKEQAVLDKLEWFRDQKFALMMHFGIYSQVGTMESWPLVDGEKEWSRVDIDWEEDGSEFRKQYFSLNRSFNPIRLEADKWAAMAKKCGFKYLILTTKHHDGFCLWDTKQTDYKVTAPECPYGASPKADIIRNVYDAFRKEGLGITTYFSKPDWHCEYFWEPESVDGETTKYPSYDLKEKPELWDKFVDFTHKQLLELVCEYGPIDTLWLDGGWIDKRRGYDIRLGEVVKKARETNPGLIVVDRTIGGEYENYITPENTIPEKPLDVPWEACLPITDTFSYRYDDKTCKTAKEILFTLIEVVAKGGNLALNVAPQPDGRLPESAMAEVAQVGEWLERCGEAIYGTRICSPYQVEDLAFTQNKDAVYAMTLADVVPEKLYIPCEIAVKDVILLNKECEVPYQVVDGGIQVDLSGISCSDYSLAFRIRKA